MDISTGDKLMLAKRLNYLAGITMPDHEDRSWSVRDMDADRYWELVTPGVKEKRLNTVDYLLGDDWALKRQSSVTEEEYQAHGEFLQAHYPNGPLGERVD